MCSAAARRGARHGRAAGASDRARGAAQARRGALQTLRGDSANIEQVETLSHTGSVASDGSARRRGAVAAKVPPFAPYPTLPLHPPSPSARARRPARPPGPGSACGRLPEGRPLVRARRLRRVRLRGQAVHTLWAALRPQQVCSAARARPRRALRSRACARSAAACPGTRARAARGWRLAPRQARRPPGHRLCQASASLTPRAPSRPILSKRARTRRRCAWCAAAAATLRARRAATWSMRAARRAWSASPTSAAWPTCRRARAACCAWVMFGARVESAPAEIRLRFAACPPDPLKQGLLDLKWPALPCIKAAQRLGGGCRSEHPVPHHCSSGERAAPVACGSEARRTQQAHAGRVCPPGCQQSMRQRAAKRFVVAPRWHCVAVPALTGGCCGRAQEALERVAVARGAVAASGAGDGMASGSSTDSALVPHLKYQLPSEPHMYVDLVDDEDVVLMFDEARPNPKPDTGSSCLPRLRSQESICC